MCPEVSTVITGLVAQHVPVRADRCPGWLDGRRSIWNTRQKSVQGGSGSVQSGSRQKSVRSGGPPDRLWVPSQRKLINAHDIIFEEGGGHQSPPLAGEDVEVAGGDGVDDTFQFMLLSQKLMSWLHLPQMSLLLLSLHLLLYLVTQLVPTCCPRPSKILSSPRLSKLWRKPQVTTGPPNTRP
jgi:hypothetical protein